MSEVEYIEQLYSDGRISTAEYNCLMSQALSQETAR